MIYLNNTTDPQRIYIPREGFLAGASDTGEYSAGQYINISRNKVISVTGLTEVIQETVTAMTLDYATTGDVQNALTSYTPTANFATINGSGITNGGDIVIQGGGDSTVLEKITELPTEPQDGATYNYNGVLMKYVNGEGKWGYWTDTESLMMYSALQMGSSTLFYAVIPSSMDGKLVFGLGYIKTSTADTNVEIWGFFNLQNNTIDVYNNKDKTGSTLYQITKNATGETYINNNNNQMYVSWKDNVIQLRCGNNLNTQLLRYCDTTVSTAHYELMQELPYNYPITRSTLTPSSYTRAQPGYAVYFDVNTGRVMPGAKLTSRAFYFNNTGYNNAVYYFSSSLQPNPNHFYAPSTSGASGTLCVSTGAESAPVWKTIVQALGVDFWTGTQDEYDAITTKSATTLYFIKQQ